MSSKEKIEKIRRTPTDPRHDLFSLLCDLIFFLLPAVNLSWKFFQIKATSSNKGAQKGHLFKYRRTVTLQRTLHAPTEQEPEYVATYQNRKLNNGPEYTDRINPIEFQLVKHLQGDHSLTTDGAEECLIDSLSSWLACCVCCEKCSEAVMQMDSESLFYKVAMNAIDLSIRCLSTGVVAKPNEVIITAFQHAIPESSIIGIKINPLRQSDPFEMIIHEDPTGEKVFRTIEISEEIQDNVINYYKRIMPEKIGTNCDIGQNGEATSEEEFGSDDEEEPKLPHEDCKLPIGDRLYRMYQCSDKLANCTKLVKDLVDCGIGKSDRRLSNVNAKIANIDMEKSEDGSCPLRHIHVKKAQFLEIIGGCEDFLEKCLTGKLIIPEWASFARRFEQVVDSCRANTDGQVAQYIPYLAEQDPDQYAVALCTTDGQRLNWGDSLQLVSLQSVCKVFSYAIALEDLGAEAVHGKVNTEPSGRAFNDISLHPNGQPFNPMVNTGAITTAALLRPNEPLSTRFENVVRRIRMIGGEEPVVFNNTIFLSEREAGHRNQAIAHLLQEKRLLPQQTSLRDHIDLYTQLCSLETSTETLALMGATLAAGGTCPITKVRCLSERTCRDSISVMFTCGVYDEAGRFARQIGVPIKSGVGGTLLLVIPNKMSIAIFSPRLNEHGNSCRGMELCQKLQEVFDFHCLSVSGPGKGSENCTGDSHSGVP